MTLEQKRSAIKRINERRKEIEKKFGKDSYPARHYREKMDILSGGNLLPSGNISHGNKALEGMEDSAIEAMLKQETAGEIVKKGKKNIAKETGKPEESITTKDLSDFYEQIRPLQDMLEELSEDMSDALFEWRRKNGFLKGSGQRRLSYAEIRQAFDEWEGSSNEFKEAHRGSDYRERARKDAENEFSGVPIAVMPGSRTEERSRVSGRSSRV